MPIYEYHCQACSTLHEFFLKVSDPHPSQCPNCKAEGTLKKQISQTSFALKGEGWYVTDYKKAESKGSPGVSSAEADTKSEEKPEAGKTASKDQAASTKESTKEKAPAASTATE